ncbi:MAG: HdeD family acid-resistance protein [Eubacteriaceae bacterium]
MDPFKHEFSELTKGHKVLGILISIVLVLLGIGCFFAPVFSTGVIIWLFISGIIVYGIFLIYSYAKATVKNGWALASGIISLILGVLLIVSPPLAKADTFAFMIGFLCMMTGVNQIGVASASKKAGAEKTGWLTASGVLNIILSFFFIFNPFIMLLAYDIIVGVYLVFGGITLFAATCSSK